MNVPCLKCPDRGCGIYHDKCKKYQAYVSESKKIRAAKIMELENYHALLESVARMKKRKATNKKG